MRPIAASRLQIHNPRRDATRLATNTQPGSISASLSPHREHGVAQARLISQHERAYREIDVVQLALNTAFGVVIGIGLYVIGVPNPVLWAIFAALMRFVPYIGAFLSAILPISGLSPSRR